MAHTPGSASRSTIVDLRIEHWSRERDYFVASAKSLGATVKVISYDRLILDAYLSFDNLRVGQMQAQGVLDMVTK